MGTGKGKSGIKGRTVDPQTGERMTRIESAVEALTGTMERLIESSEERFQKLEEALTRESTERAQVLATVGRTNRESIGLLLTAILPVCSLAAFAVYGPIRANEKRVDEVANAHTAQWDKQTDLNIAQQRELGELSTIKDLLIRGRIMLTPAPQGGGQ